MQRSRSCLLFKALDVSWPVDLNRYVLAAVAIVDCLTVRLVY